MPRKTKQNIITSPELLGRVNPKNTQLIDDFLSYLKSIQRSDTTRTAYKNDLEIWACWNLQHNDNKFFCDMSKRNVVAYQNWLLNENQNSPARVRRLRSTLSALGNYIEAVLDDEFPDYRNIINKIPAPVNEPVREKTVFTDEQLTTLLDVLMGKGQYQKACALALAMCSGARKSELTRFKVSYFVQENIIYESLYKTPEKIKTKGRGVNGKMLNKYILSAEFQPYFDAWLTERERLGINSEWLLVSKNRDDEWVQMKPDTLNSWAITFSNILGVDFYWHSLRHFFTTHLSTKLNVPDGIIKSIVGWANVSMVEIYKDVDEDEEIGKYFGDQDDRPEFGLFK